MKTSTLRTLSLVLSLALFLSACGASNSAGGGGGGGGNPPPTVEILYAASFWNSIFTFSIDQSSGALTQTAAVMPGGDTDGNEIAITPSGSFLYASNDDGMGINGYATDSSGALTLTASSPFVPASTMAGIGSLTVDPTGSFLYASSSSGFGVVGFTIDSTTGALTSAPGGPFTSPGYGGPPVGITIDPTGNFLYASASFDASASGGYNIWGFTINAQSGALTSMPGSPFATQENSQPYGIQVDPSGKFLYVALSNAGSIAAFTIDSTTGALTTVAGSPFATASTQFTQTYKLTISPSGKFLYAFNLNGDTIAAFTINPTTGALTTVAGSPFAVNPTGGSSLIVDPSDQFLYLTIGSGPPNIFDIFDIDQNSGALTPNSNSPIAGSQDFLGMAVAKFQ
jgi:6-phosphogluconolactonase